MDSGYSLQVPNDVRQPNIYWLGFTRSLSVSSKTLTLESC